MERIAEIESAAQQLTAVEQRLSTWRQQLLRPAATQAMAQDALQEVSVV